MNPYLKLIIVLFLYSLSIPILYAQGNTWAVKAFQKNGESLDVKAVKETGESYLVFAIEDAKSKHFMDIKAKEGNNTLAIKLILSGDYYAPVKAITPNNQVLDVKAFSATGESFDLKGVARSGNTIRISAVTAEEEFLAVRAISPEGINRDVMGIKFLEENIEMEFGPIKAIAHVKAIPTTKTTSEYPEWPIKAISPDGSTLDIFAKDDKGREYPIKAFSPGGNYQLLDVKAIMRRDKAPVKLVKDNTNIILVALDEVGRTLPIQVKSDSGEFFPVKGINPGGNVIDIKGVLPNNVQYAIKAISPEGDLYDIKGLKAKKSDKEGVYIGFVKTVNYFSHVKALPQID